jgi:hypothetical protein
MSALFFRCDRWSSHHTEFPDLDLDISTLILSVDIYTTIMHFYRALLLSVALIVDTSNVPLVRIHRSVLHLYQLHLRGQTLQNICLPGEHLPTFSLPVLLPYRALILWTARCNIIRSFLLKQRKLGVSLFASLATPFGLLIYDITMISYNGLMHVEQSLISRFP